jgi:hypothetical protein
LMVCSSMSSITTTTLSCRLHPPPRLRSSMTCGSAHHLHETCKQQARRKEGTVKTQNVRVRVEARSRD